MNRLLLAAVLMLALGAALQIHRLLVVGAGPGEALGPGDLLPSALGFESEACWSGFLVNTECSFCRELIARAHQREDLHWIIAGRKVAIDSLLQRYPIEPGRIRMAVEAPDRLDPFAELGVWAVPTRVVASGLRVTQLRPGGVVLSPDSVRSLCGIRSR